MADEISSLKTALQQVLRHLGLERRLKSERIGIVWPQVVGPTVAKITHPQECRHGTLFLTVIDSVWMQELKLQERDLIERLNDTLGEPLVRRLFLRLGDVPAASLPRHAGTTPPPQADRPADLQEEGFLARGVSGVRDPELRAMLQRLGRRMLTAKGTTDGRR